jgi:hypothetical protein
MTTDKFIATHVIETPTERIYVHAYAESGPEDLSNSRGLVLYTEDEWAHEIHADWEFDPRDGLMFQGSVADATSISRV